MHITFRRPKPIHALAAVVVVVVVSVAGYSFLHHEPAPPSQAELDSIARHDSAALHVALVTNNDCLPLFYAKAAGLVDTTQLDLRLLPYEGHLDCDTALRFAHAEVGYVDVARIVLISHKDSLRLRLIGSLPTDLRLMVNKSKTRITSLAKLRHWIVGIDRHSAADYFSDALMDSAKLGLEDIYRTQINDQHLREKMTTSAQIEAALLTEPFATLAKTLGHRELWHSPAAPALVGFAAPDSVLAIKERKAQIKLLFETYEKGVEALLNEPDEDVLLDLLRHTYGFTDEEITVACKVKPHHLLPPDTKALPLMRDFLARRGRVPKTLDVKQLTYELKDVAAPTGH